MSGIRTPREEDRQSVVDLIRVSFNPPAGWARHIAPETRLDRFLCGFEEGRAVSMGAAYDLRQWLGGRPVAAQGIGLVAVSPERRGAGHGKALIEALLRKGREAGAAVSLLYPSRADVYRRAGYEFSGVLTQYRLDLEDLPAGERGRVEEIGDGSIERVRDCYREFASRNTGLVESGDEDWWRLRVLRRGIPEATTRAAAVTGPDGVEAYAAFRLDPFAGGIGFDVVCTHLVSNTPGGSAGILSYLRGYRGVGRSLIWYGPPTEPLGIPAGPAAESLKVDRSARFMSRILSVPAALEQRGYPPVSGRAVFAVEDGLFPDNRGPFLIEAGEGRVRVTPRPGQAAPAIPVGALSALHSGYLTADDLARVGLLPAGTTVPPLLGALFTGPTPWMTDFF